MKRYEIEFYTDKSGRSQIVEWMHELNDSPSKEKKSILKKLYY